MSHISNKSITPKLSAEVEYSNNKIYKYYAGYSDAFVKAQIEILLGQKKDSIILDPWNGSGTTTLVASLLGYNSYGIDINPVMVIVSKAKLYYPQANDTLKLIDEIDHSIKVRNNLSVAEDPLLNWFDEYSVRSIRKLEHIIRIYCGYDDSAFMKFFMNIDNITYQLAFYYVVLFEQLRTYTSSFVGSNPTWLKVAENDESKIRLSYSTVCTDYKNYLSRFVLFLDSKISNKAIIQIGDSRNILLPDESIDFIITSPPYCTRIDYAVYTRVELALIGYNKDEFDLVRRGMIGTPTISTRKAELVPRSKAYEKLLEKIDTHDSKAAHSYYRKTYEQYFFDMDKSISEITRILKGDSMISMVIQDSWFKDIYIDLPNIIRNIFEDYGFALVSEKKSKVTSNMRYINTNSKQYGSKKNYETVLIMKKG